MKNKGFILIDILTGLFLIGLITVVSLPLISSSHSNYLTIRTITEMNYLGESIYERLCSEDNYSRGLIEELTTSNEVLFNDLSLDYLEKYTPKIKKTGQTENLLEIKIVITSNSHGGNIADVEFKGTILR
ncbi:MAG: hypothetical protein GX053_13970 [Tissierella sp.]|nr:hypothetical protein [Tissierella sp.]